MSVEFEGADRLMARLNKMSDEAELKKSLETAALLVERSAREKAPKDTGALRRSIRSKVEGLEGIVYTPLEYAPYIEYGTGLFAEKGNGRKDVPWNYQDDKGKWHSTSGLKPHPFMRPSLDENRQKILEILKEGVMDDG